MNKKYELTDETINLNGKILYRIKALRDFSDVKKGDLGGFIEKEDNLSHEGDCWIYDDAIVYGNARIYDDARIYDKAWVHGNAKVYHKAKIYNDSIVSSNARIYGNAIVDGNARVYGDTRVYDHATIYNNTKIGHKGCINSIDSYITIGPIGSRDDYTTFYLDKNRNIWVKCGCFNDTIDKFKEEVLKVHKNNKYGKDYLAAIEFVKVKLI